jgi:hypothetical protein
MAPLGAACSNVAGRSYLPLEPPFTAVKKHSSGRYYVIYSCCYLKARIALSASSQPAVTQLRTSNKMINASHLLFASDPNFCRSPYFTQAANGLDDRKVGVRVPVGEIFSPLHVVQTGSEVRPASYTMGKGGSFLGSKTADHSPPTSAEVKKMWIYTSTPPYVFMA